MDQHDIGKRLIDGDLSLSLDSIDPLKQKNGDNHNVKRAPRFLARPQGQFFSTRLSSTLSKDKLQRGEVVMETTQV